MDGPRSARASEVMAAADLANRVFRLAAHLGPTMHLEFPCLFCEEHPEQLWIVREGERVISLVGAFRRDLYLQGCRTSTAALGAVCTDPAYRSQGLAGLILRSLALHLTQQGVRVLIISGDRPLYRRMGGVRSGLVHWITVPASPTPTLAAAEDQWWVEEVRPEQSEQLAEVLRLYEQEPVRFERSLEDLRGFVGALPHGFDGTRYRRLWLARQGRSGPARAYLTTDGPTWPAASPAVDEPIYWQAREWGGDRAAVWRLAAELAGGHGVNGVRFPVSSIDHDLLNQARRHGFTVDITDSTPWASWGGTFVGLNPQGLLVDLQPLLGEELAGHLLAALTAGRITPPVLLAILFGQEAGWWTGSRATWLTQLRELLGMREEERGRVETLASPLPLAWIWGNTLNYV